MVDPAPASPYALLAGTPAERTLARGAALFHAGDAVTDMFFVRAGALTLQRVLADGRVVPVGRAGAGETVAEASLFAERYHCDCVAAADSTVVACRKVEVLASLTASPQRALRLLRHMAGEVQDLRRRVEVLSQPGAAGRILAYVAAHAEAGGGAWAMDRTWKAVAAELALSHEALYRALARLERAGRLIRDGSTVRLDG
ncbi:MAG: Crp/Fnr family transcriptional regulator [Alphaproteobacteria bacterium]